MKKKTEVEKSSGNVFADLGLGDAEETLAKAKLASRICAIVEERKLTQVEAAELLEVDQPTVSHLVRGQLTRFSTDRLFRFLTMLGQDIDIVIRPKARRRSQAKIRVRSPEPTEA